MAKDVDLSSKEWRDIVFEGKNKDFGAYQLRQASEKRHNVAMIAVIVILAVVAALAFLVNTVIAKVEARPEDDIEQTMVDLSTDAAEEEPVEENQRIEQEQPQVLPEEILNTVKMAEIRFVEDSQAEEIRSVEETREDDRVVGVVDEDRGSNDNLELNIRREEQVVVEERAPAPVEDNHVFTTVEQMPTFPGGEQALLQYVASHLRYPQTAADDGIQGRVVVRFVVTKTGSIGDVQVARSRHPDLDREAVRVVKSLPNFVPGKMNGHAVNVWYTLPVNFKLANQ